MITPRNDSIILQWRGTTIRLDPPRYFWVYTIHFHDKLAHGCQSPTGHYTGMCSDIDARLARHRVGNGSRLMHVVASRNIAWDLAQLIRCSSYQEAHELERRLKKHGASRRCPLCLGKQVDDLVFMRQGHYRFSNFDKPGRRRPRSMLLGGCLL